MEQNKPWWVSTKEFLPDEGEKVLIITRFGTVTDAALRTYLHTGKQKICPVLFSPDAYKPNEDVKWWMPIPEDGWHDIKEETPMEGDIALTMGMYGRIFSGVWKNRAEPRSLCLCPMCGIFFSGTRCRNCREE